MYRIAVCDDDMEFCDSLERRIHKFFSEKSSECSIKSFPDINSIDIAINNGMSFDLLFLDVIFKDDNGIDYAKRLRAKDKKIDIVFITVCKEYAVESYDIEPLYYLLKPVDSDKLYLALNRFLEKNTPDYICINISNGIRKIRLSDILYFEIYGHRIIIHNVDKTESDFRGVLKDIENQLPPATFIRPHRSYLVNINFITEITHYNIKMINGYTIPISKALYNKIQLEFVECLDKKNLLI